MKLRLLNVSHQAMTYFGFLKGHRYAHEAAGDPDIARLLKNYMDLEATPTLKPVPGIDLDEYKESLIERFSNPEVRDTLARLCSESSDRIPKWLLPVVRENLAHGGEVRLSAAICASWARYDEAVDEEGNPITVVDRLAAQLVPLAQAQRGDRTIFIRNSVLFGDLSAEPAFSDAYVQTLDSLINQGSAATLATLT
jgi:mannitol 2-dehydrogenase